MDGIVSLLPQPYYDRVIAIWKDLEHSCGVRGAQVTPYPHFSWQIGEKYDHSRLEETLRNWASRMRPLRVISTGLGLFSGMQPAIYIPIVKTAELNAFHQSLWQAMEGCGTGISEYYSPLNWVPHITLAMADVTPINLGKVMNRLAFEHYNWAWEVDNLAFVQQSANTAEVLFTIPIGN